MLLLLMELTLDVLGPLTLITALLLGIGPRTMMVLVILAGASSWVLASLHELKPLGILHCRSILYI